MDNFTTEDKVDYSIIATSEVIIQDFHRAKKHVSGGLKMANNHCNPGSENSNQDLFDYLAEQYGSTDHVEQMTNRVEEVARKLGIEMNFENINFTANTLIANPLLEFVTNPREKSKLKEALLKAYFTNNIHVGLKDNLIKIVKEANISDLVIEQFNKTDNTKQVEDKQNSIKKAGINSVPSFIINDQFLIQGAQETDVFIKAFTDISKEK